MAKKKYEYCLTEDALTRIGGWARDGLNDAQIAHNMGISRKTLYEWEKKYGDIRDTLKKSKDIVDREVENALLKRALGYEYDEVTRERKKSDDTGEYGLIETKRVTKQVIPDVTAQIFWLKNRKPDEWRDKRDVAVSSDRTDKLDEMMKEFDLDEQ